MPQCKCFYDGDLLDTFTLSDRELKVASAESGGVKRLLMDRLKRSRSDMAIDDPGRFDYVVELG